MGYRRFYYAQIYAVLRCDTKSNKCELFIERVGRSCCLCGGEDWLVFSENGNLMISGYLSFYSLLILFNDIIKKSLEEVFHMGLFDGMMGDASEVDAAKVEKEVSELLTANEKVEHAYKLIRDLFIFTNKRLILVDKQGVTGKKTEYHSLPYKSITHFAVETAGTFDLDAELKIWVSGNSEPIGKTFNKQLNIYDVQAVLASYVC
jgi:hypothetical protein